MAGWLEMVRGASCTVTDKQCSLWTFIMGYAYFPHDIPGVHTPLVPFTCGFITNCPKT